MRSRSLLLAAMMGAYMSHPYINYYTQSPLRDAPLCTSPYVNFRSSKQHTKRNTFKRAQRKQKRQGRKKR